MTTTAPRPEPLCSRLDAAIGLALFVASLGYFSLSLGRHLELRDEGYMLHGISRVAAGDVPHRDFTEIYGPGVYWLNAIVLRAFEREILPIRAVIALFKAAAVLLTYLVTRELVSRTAAVLGAVLAIAYWGRMVWNLNSPYAVLYTVPLLMLSLLSIMRAGRGGPRRLYAASGFVIGVTLVFKQSLALFSGYGMGLAILAIATLEGPPGKWSRIEVGLLLFGWALAGIFVMLPFLPDLTLRDYLLHFLPIHSTLALVAAAGIRRGRGASLRTVWRDRLLPFGLSAALVPLIVAILYASWGALDTLIYDMFILPQRLQAYELPVEIPPGWLSLGIFGGLSLLAAALLASSRRVGLSILAGALAVGLLAAARIAGSDGIAPVFLSELWAAPLRIEGVLPAAVLLAALAIHAPELLRRDGPLAQRTLYAAVPLLFFQAFLVVEIFPRAGFNVVIHAAPLALLMVVVLFRVYELLGFRSEARPRRLMAAALLALIPIWLSAHVVKPVLLPSASQAQRRALRLPSTRGIALNDLQLDGMRIRDTERLIARLDVMEPRDGPLFLLTSEWLIAYLSERPGIFADEANTLINLYYDMLPESDLGLLDQEMMIDRLRRSPGVVIVDGGGEGSRVVRAALPKLAAYIDANFVERQRIGSFELLTRTLGEPRP